MPNIPELKIGNTTYDLHDKRVDDLNSALSTKSVWNNDRQIGENILLDLSNYTCFQGSITGDTGSVFLVNTRVSSEMIYIYNIWMISIKVASGYKYLFTEYDNGGKFIRQTSFVTEKTNYFTRIKSDEYIRITIAKSDNSPITVNEALSAIEYVRLYKYDQNDLQQSRTNAKGWQAVQFTHGAEDKLLRRATSGNFVFGDCIVEVIGDRPDLVNIHVDIKDKDYNIIKTAYNSSQRQQSIWLHKSEFPTGKYFSVSAGNGSNNALDITSEMLDYLNNNVYIHPFEAEELTGLSANDLWLARIQAHNDSSFEDDLYVQNRITSKKIYKNVGQLITIMDRNYFIYARYYDENFQIVSDTEWSSRYIDTSIEDAPYFRLSVKNKDGTNLTTNDVLAVANSINVNGVLVPSATINGQDGELNTGVNAIRCATYPFRWIDDSYIKLHNAGFDMGIAIYDEQKVYLKCIDWFTYSSETGRTDKAVRLQNCYVRFYFAKQNRTEDFTVSDRITLQNGILDGSILEIVDAVRPHSIGFQTINGYPTYYAEEMSQTINAICNKIGRDSTVFAMITDLHDNDHDHYSETLAYQQNALRLIKDKARLDFVLCGGDLTDGAFSSKQELLDKFTDHRCHFSMINAPTLFMRGNHDENSYFSLVAANCITKDEFYARLIATEKGNISPSGTAYYYHDFDDVNVRVIVLDFIDYPWEVDSSGNLINYAVGGDGVWRGYSNEQIHWLAGVALNTNKRIIITGHYSTHRNLTSTWEKSVEHNWDEVNKAMLAYQSRGSYTFDGQTYNFADRTGKILAQVTGHSHSFGAFKENGIIWSTTGSPSTDVTHRTYDNTQYETMGSRAYGDITEAHFNVFVCDDNNVHIISFGQMGDLDFTV